MTLHRWETWELEQRRYALQSLVSNYSVTNPGSRRHRMYMNELDMVNAEMRRRSQIDSYKQMVLDF